jgi:tetratricopeptide (TPR) repeat protein
MKKSLLSLLFCLSIQFVYPGTKDSLMSVINQKKNEIDTHYIRACYNLAWEYIRENTDSTIYFANESLVESNKIDWYQGKVKSNLYLAMANFYLGNYHQSNEYFDEVEHNLNIMESTGKDLKFVSSERAVLSSYRGAVYYDKGNYVDALNSYFKALTYNEKNGVKNGAASNLSNIGLVYTKINEYDNAVIYYHKALSLNKELNREKGIAGCYGNLGLLYAQSDIHDSALYYFDLANEHFEKLNMVQSYAYNLGNIGMTYEKIEQYEKAMEAYLKSLELRKEIGNNYHIATQMGEIARLYFKMNKIDLAKKYFDETKKLAKEVESFDLYRDTYENMSTFYELTNKPTEALEHYKLYIQYRDSIFSQDNLKERTKLETTYEFEKEQLIKQQQQQEQERIEQEEKERRDNIQYSLIFLGILLVFGSILGLGFIKVSSKFAEGLIFFAFLIFFEFCLVLLDPIIEDWSSGEPIYKLLFNALLAGAIFPLHAFFEKILKNKLINEYRKS